MSVGIIATNNRVVGTSYDNNGNNLTFGTYDILNRLRQSTGAVEYGYDPNNRRVWKKIDSNPANDEFYFWAGNQRLGAYKSANPGSAPFTSEGINTYFGGRLIRQAKPIAIYNTGVGSGGLAADGATDTHYTLASSADSGVPGPPAKVVNSSAWPIPPWMSNGPNSKWLAPQANQGTGNAPGSYTYRTTFDLTGSDPATAQLTGQWATDDSGVIMLNGNTVGTASGGFGSCTNFTITSGFIAGVNTLDFVVTNGGSSANPTAVRVEISGTVGTAVLIDRLGSNVTGGKRYFPFGQEKPSATTNNTEKFTGYFRDAETGLDYASQRYHHPGSGRFVTPDPVGSGLNWYTYAAGDPINNVDPTGTVVDGATTTITIDGHTIVYCGSSYWLAFDDCMFEIYMGWAKDNLIPRRNTGPVVISSGADAQADEIETCISATGGGGQGGQLVPNVSDMCKAQLVAALLALTREDISCQATGLTEAIDGYLTGYGSPMAGLGYVFVREGCRYNVDPRFIVALAAETSMGKVITWGSYNAWNWGWNIRNQSHSPFISWAVGIMQVTRGIRRIYFNNLEARGLDINTSNVYLGVTISVPGAPDQVISPKYCSSLCHVETIDKILTQLGGNPNQLTFPIIP